jgi:hypothetical protein
MFDFSGAPPGKLTSWPSECDVSQEHGIAVVQGHQFRQVLPPADRGCRKRVIAKLP